MKKLINIFWSGWKVSKTIFPYLEGYGTYRVNYLTGQRTILDTGLSREYAKQVVKDLNA